ncbi:MAG: glycosyltransferase family 2 protein, partial [Oscillospiraceae bacterium]|nr:glycosyltransferase family 2 protein [Oscillospiraceae bacterium]
SFVIPCYRSELSLEAVVEEIRSTVAQREGYDYEINLVNDCSPDGVWQVIKRLAGEDKKIHGVSLARNFGEYGAVMAGMRMCTGDIAVFLDDDGQTPANELFSLVDALDEDCDVAFASYLWPGSGKKHSAFRRFGSRVNDLMLRLLLKKPKDLEATSYIAAKRYVVEEACRYANPYPYSTGLFLRTTSKVKNVPVHHRERELGRSGYNFKKLLSLWFDGLTSFSIVPLRIATGAGCVFSLAGFIYTIFLIIERLTSPDIPLGYASTMAAVLVIGGILMLLIGMLGEYLGRIYISINNNPQYVIRERTDGND